MRNARRTNNNKRTNCLHFAHIKCNIPSTTITAKKQQYTSAQNRLFFGVPVSVYETWNRYNRDPDTHTQLY